MKNIKFILAGIFFGIVLTKGEAISWYRMQEMFHFQSFHMFGIFMTAIPVGALSIMVLRKLNIKTTEGDSISIPDKTFHKGIIFGSLIFGFGWALTGACPGPIYAQLGSGVLVTIVTLASALFGTWTYALVRENLPH
ncbi:MAG: DUF6691 family protein [Bacteroidota bacterium]